jgi:hypothetical protein
MDMNSLEQMKSMHIRVLVLSPKLSNHRLCTHFDNLTTTSLVPLHILLGEWMEVFVFRSSPQC